MMPREKLVKMGASNLTDTELIAAILSTGSQRNGVMSIAQTVQTYITEAQQLKEELSIQRLIQIKGIGIKKAVSLLAAFELGIRLTKTPSNRITNATLALPYIQYISKYRQEHVVGIFLNARFEILKRKEIHIGNTDSTPVSPYDIAHTALANNAVSVILAHNHPSGDPMPSQEDLLATQKLIKALRLLEISLLDHIVIAKDSWVSIKENSPNLWKL